MAFYDFLAQHWQSIRTSNPIESTFATIRHRTKRSKGCLTRDGMLHMMFKPGQCAQENWRRLRGFAYLAKVITGVKFKDGIEVTDVNQAAAWFCQVTQLSTTMSGMKQELSYRGYRFPPDIISRAVRLYHRFTRAPILWRLPGRGRRSLSMFGIQTDH